MDELLEEIVKLHSEMEKLTLEAGVPHNHLKAILMMPSGIIEKEIKERSDFLYKLRHGVYLDLLAINVDMKSLSLAAWKLYEAMHGKNTRAHLILAETQKKLRKAWKEWYVANQTKFNLEEADSTNSEQSSVQPERKDTDVNSAVTE